MIETYLLLSIIGGFLCFAIGCQKQLPLSLFVPLGLCFPIIGLVAVIAVETRDTGFRRPVRNERRYLLTGGRPIRR